jgi:CheY-like chemotaxis protein
MAEGGTLTISGGLTRGPDPSGLPGGSVCLAIEDTGSGMSPEVLERVFEPFFTTKEVGRGSGLGLSQVYGFVRQSEGHVRISSQAKVGTRFEILLPASAEPAAAPGPKVVQDNMVGGAERILVAEDDAAVLKLTVDLLEGLGYAVRTATTADEAMAVLREDREIDLLFSDVVMPGGMSGIALARTAQRERPDLKILLTSGFVGDKAVLGGADHLILDKPYAASALAANLRKLLDSRGRAPARKRASRAAGRPRQSA